MVGQICKPPDDGLSEQRTFLAGELDFFSDAFRNKAGVAIIMPRFLGNLINADFCCLSFGGNFLVNNDLVALLQPREFAVCTAFDLFHTASSLEMY